MLKQPFLKVFAAIFLDGELEGSPFEGLDQASVAHELVDYFHMLQQTNRYTIFSQDKVAIIKMHLQHFAFIAERFDKIDDSKLDLSDQISAISEQIIQKFSQNNDIFFPGGWTADPSGHAMVYRLFYDNTGQLIFLAYNGGNGADYHKKIESKLDSNLNLETYRELFNPVFAIRFDKLKPYQQPGELQDWIEKLIEPQIWPRFESMYTDNNAQSIYKKILPLSAYLNGCVIDPDPYFPWTSAGQKSGTCAQYSLQQAVRTFLQSNLQYDEFILDYRLHILKKYMAMQVLPSYFEVHFHRAIQYTAAMITSGKQLEQSLSEECKQTLIEELTCIQKDANRYFQALPKMCKQKKSQPTITPQHLLLPRGNKLPVVNNADKAGHSDLTHRQSLLFFDPSVSFVKAVVQLRSTRESKDKRLFIYNLEQLCFIFCSQIKDFKTKPLNTKDDDSQSWAIVIQLLHQYSLEYFDFYYDYTVPSEFDRYARSWFKQPRWMQQNSRKKPSKANAPSPRKQLIWLALMTLQHYSMIHYHGALLGLVDDWQSILQHLDDYTAYIPHWMIREKMQRDFFLSSTDPSLSQLFHSLNDYYRNYYYEVEADKIGTVLIKHYIQLMQSSYFKEEKDLFERLYETHAKAIRSKCSIETELERALFNSGLMAIYLLNEKFVIKQIPNCQWPTTPKLIQLMQMHHHTDLTFAFNSEALLKGSDANLGHEQFRIGQYYGVFTCLQNSFKNLVQRGNNDNSNWITLHTTYASKGINQVAQGSGATSQFNCNLLLHDVEQTNYTSNQICLLTERAQIKIQRHLRTALPLQAVQLLDYFTEHMHLLLERDNQFYLLFSLFQPRVIGRGIDHGSDLLLALETFYHKGIALGDLSPDTIILSNRGFFLIKLICWILGYVVTAYPEAINYRLFYTLIDDALRGLILQDQPEPIKTELQRLSFYNLMKLFSPELLSLPENKHHLRECLFSYFYINHHLENRVPGTITMTEDECFEPLFLNLLLINPNAIQLALPEVLNRLISKQSPFELEPSELTPDYIYTNCNQQKIRVDLINGQISIDEKNLIRIPTDLKQVNTAFQNVCGAEADPSATLLNSTTYEFIWEDDWYRLNDEALFKKINDSWYEYTTVQFLPQVVQQISQFAWVNETNDHALIMQTTQPHCFNQVGEYKEGQLHLQEPKGQFCVTGEARNVILQMWSVFEQSSMVSVIQLDNQLDTYQFYLPFYQLTGHYSSAQGMSLHFNQRTFYVLEDDTPFATGIWLENTDDAENVRLYLVPIQPFYRQKSPDDHLISSAHYHLKHDVERVLQNNDVIEKKFAVFQYDSYGRLNADLCSTDRLYLAYLYCGRYDFDRAYELLRHYVPQGKPEELIYLFWICEKLPAKYLASNQTDKEPNADTIITPILLAIQLKALLLLRQIEQETKLNESASQSARDFLTDQHLVDFTLNRYNRYHRVSDHLSHDKKLSSHDITMLATDVHLRFESIKQREIQKLNQLKLKQKGLNEKTKLHRDRSEKLKQQIIQSNKQNFNYERTPVGKQVYALRKQYDNNLVQYDKRLSSLCSDIQQQSDTIKKLEYQQRSGYLALVYAKKPIFFNHASEPRKNSFNTQFTAEYSQHTIQPAWPLRDFIPSRTPYLNYQIKFEDDLAQITPEPLTIYINCTSTSNLAYLFLDESGKSTVNSSLNIDEKLILNALTKDMHTLTATEIKALKRIICLDAIQSRNLEPNFGTLSDLIALQKSPARGEGYKAACEQLSLTTTDDQLLSNLLYYFGLLLEDPDAFLLEKNRLRAFCITTVIAYEDLNESLKKIISLGTAAKDERRCRLSIALVLLKALDYPSQFKTSYEVVIQELSSYSSTSDLKSSLWSIVSYEKYGFNARFLPSLPPDKTTPILVQSGELQSRTHQIVKRRARPYKSVLQQTTDDSSVQSLQLNLHELPVELMALSQLLNQFNDVFQISRERVIQSFINKTTSEQHQCYAVVDSELDALDHHYHEQLLSSISPSFFNRSNIISIRILTARLSADIVDLSLALQKHASFLPMTLQDLLSTQIDQLSGAVIPVDIDRLLLHYACGIDDDYLAIRHVPTTMVPIVRKSLNNFLRHVYLYRQLQSILTIVADINSNPDPLEQADKQVSLAEKVLELRPLNAHPALALFQYQTDKSIRLPQRAMINRLTQSNDTSNRAEQLMMGQGKTKVIIPQLIFLKADGKHLAMVLVPEALLQTEYQDLKYTAKLVYNQDINLFHFDRCSPSEPIHLKRYLIDFEETILQRKGLVMSTSSLQSLYLKQRELLFQAQNYQDGSLEYIIIIEQLTILKDIVNLFKNKADVIVDELHKVLDINVELNYSIGRKQSIDSETIELALNLYQFLDSTPVIAEDNNDVLFPLNGKSLSDFLANPTVLYHPEDLVVKLMHYYESCYFKQHDISRYSEKMRNFITAQWRIFLPATLKSKADERYGHALSDDIAIAVPYAGNNVPTTRLFENYIESMNYTIQLTYLKGVTYLVFKKMIIAWKKSDQQVYSNAQSLANQYYQNCLARLTENEREQLPVTLKTFDVTNELVLKKYYTYLRHNQPFIHYTLQENIVPSIVIYPYKLTSNAIHLTRLVHRIQGVSGTLSSHPSFERSIQFNQATSFGIKNKIKHVLLQKQTRILIQCENNDYHGILALIDIGAHQRGKSNQQVAMELAHQFHGSRIQYVLFFKEDQLAAWKVDGTEADIIFLPSTEPTIIENYLGVELDERFTYYSQTNAIGIDLLHARNARARVTLDVTTTLSEFVQAVMRMRQLFAEQTIEIVISDALRDKLSNQINLNNLYDCLECFEAEQLANDVFKSACNQLIDCVQADLEQRLFGTDAQTSVHLFPSFQSLLIGVNSTDVPSYYGEERTREILIQIRDKAFKTWADAIYSDRGKDYIESKHETYNSLKLKCNDIIEHALVFCRATQQSNIALGTEVSVEQQQETQIQVKLKIEQQTDPLAELLYARSPNMSWCQEFTIDQQGNPTGDEHARNHLSAIWNNAQNVEAVDWSNALWVSTEFYMIHERQALNTLHRDLPLKPILSTLFWKSNTTDSVYGLIICQEEAELLAKRLSKGDLDLPLYQVWLETPHYQVPLAGVRPENLANNVSYQRLKEQISVLDGNVIYLAEKTTWVWFDAKHCSVLRQQMINQEKHDEISHLIDLEKKFEVSEINIKQKMDNHEEQIDNHPSREPSPRVPTSRAIPVCEPFPVTRNINYSAQIRLLTGQLDALAKSSPFKKYGIKILHITKKLDKLRPIGVKRRDLIETLEVTNDLLSYLSENHQDPDVLIQKANACSEQGFKIKNLTHANVSSVRKWGAILLGLAGVALVAASILFAAATHFIGSPIAIAGIKLGFSYLAASVVGITGCATNLVGVGLFATRKPYECQLAEALDKISDTANPSKLRLT